jgi:hypothetical protein
MKHDTQHNGYSVTHCADCRYDKCRYAECHQAWCRSALWGFPLLRLASGLNQKYMTCLPQYSLNAIMLSVIMLSVVAPFVTSYS